MKSPGIPVSWERGRLRVASAQRESEPRQKSKRTPSKLASTPPHSADKSAHCSKEGPIANSRHQSVSRRLGQNFLTDKNVIQHIVDSLHPTSDETIIEIGPGKGALTFELVKKTGRVIAIEFDRNLVPALRESLSSFPNFELLEADALAVDFCAEMQPATKARLVANLPYNISTAILHQLWKRREVFTRDQVNEVIYQFWLRLTVRQKNYLMSVRDLFGPHQKSGVVLSGSSSVHKSVWQ